MKIETFVVIMSLITSIGIIIFAAIGFLKVKKIEANMESTCNIFTEKIKILEKKYNDFEEKINFYLSKIEDKKKSKKKLLTD